MNEKNHSKSHSKSQPGRPNSDGVHHGHGPYWKRAHRDWRFVVAVILMLVAMVVYVLSDDLAFRPRIQPQQPLVEDVGE